MVRSNKNRSGAASRVGVLSLAPLLKDTTFVEFSGGSNARQVPGR